MKKNFHKGPRAYTITNLKSLHTHEDSSSISLLPISFTRNSQPSSRAHVSWRSTLGVATRVAPLVITLLGQWPADRACSNSVDPAPVIFTPFRPVGLVNVRMIARSLNSAQRDWDEEGRVRNGRMEGGARTGVGCTVFRRTAYTNAIFETLPAPLMHISPLQGPIWLLSGSTPLQFRYPC